jgi:hypothetical protein
LETVLPGSTDELYKWALEERRIDSIGEIVNSSLAENPTSLAPITLVMYHLYTSPGASEEAWTEQISQTITRRGMTAFGPQKIGSVITGTRGYTRVPAWFFNMVSSLYANSLSRFDITSTVTNVILRNPQAVFSNPVFLRRGRISSLVFIWLQFCVKELQGGAEQACRYDQQTDHWELLTDEKTSFFRHMLLQSLHPGKIQQLEKQGSIYVKSEPN